MARNELIKRMKASGAKIEIDDVANIYARLDGTDPDARRIVMASHVDSVKSVYDKPFKDFMGVEIDGDFPPMAAIPTTAGTGSEATKFTVIIDSSTKVKMLLKGSKLIPDLAVVDYEYTKSSPKNITVSTGLDALTHAVEAYTSKLAQPLCDALAISAVKRIFKYLPKAYEDGEKL